MLIEAYRVRRWEVGPSICSSDVLEEKDDWVFAGVDRLQIPNRNCCMVVRGSSAARAYIEPQTWDSITRKLRRHMGKPSRYSDRASSQVAILTVAR